MKITKDLQNYLRIVSIIIQKNGMDYLCYLSRYSEDLFTFQIASPINFNKNETVLFQFNFKDTTENIQGTLIDFGENFLQVKLSIPTLPNITNFIEKLNEMVKNDEIYGRRKEARIKLGLADYKKFSLVKKEQIVVAKNFQFIQPCILMDVSIHGVCFLTPYTSILNKIEIFKIKVDFLNPEESIIVDAHKVHVNIKLENNKKYAIISCQLLEPIHYVWKNKVISLICSL